MIVYLWDAEGRVGGYVEAPPGGPFPPRCTPTPPPEPVPGMVTLWRSGWVQEPIPQKSLEEMKALLLEAVTDQRWRVETGGLDVNGVLVSTGLDDQNRIASVLAAAQIAGIASVDFKSASGWVTLSVAELAQTAGMIAQHVQSCFSAERRHHEAIDQLTTVEAVEGYDVSQLWPVAKVVI